MIKLGWSENAVAHETLGKGLSRNMLVLKMMNIGTSVHLQQKQPRKKSSTYLKQIFVFGYKLFIEYFHYMKIFCNFSKVIDVLPNFGK